MGLSPGSRVGAYEVVSAIGAGGMGQVYRARDTRLGRDVALKILPREFAADPDRLARFRREAQVLAALNHPHIATIHGIEDTDPSTGSGQAAVSAIVMELVAGVTLAERLSAAHGALEPDEALRIARQIALALESAHDHGIVHRDLKPANVKVSDDGVVKVLDFGLAKALAPDGAGATADDSPTITGAAGTQVGMILGTAAYMSPEQARGKVVDKRADIWAFGVVLHEMLTGRRLFRGESATDVIAQVLTREPDWQALPNSIPSAIRTLLKRCLTRDPNNRLRDIGDARLIIDESLAHPDQDLVAAAPVAPRSRTARIWSIAAAALAGMAAGGFAGFSLTPAPAAGPVAVTTRTSITLPANQVLADPLTTTVAISPDGRRLIYKASVAGKNKLFLRELDLGGEARAIPDSDAADNFAFSPDGQSLAFNAGGSAGVLRVPLSGGTPIKICGCSAHMGMFWSSDGYIYFPVWADKKWSLRRVLASGGGPTPLPVPAEYAGKQLTHPAPLPGGRLLVVMSDPDGDTVVQSASIAVYDIQAATVTPLGLRGVSPWYLPTGHLLFGRGSVLHAVRFDAAALKVMGEPMPLVENVTSGEGSGHPAYDYAVANEAGTVVYSAATFTRTRVVKFKEDGAPELVLDAQGFLDIDLSSDGRHLAVTMDPRGIGHPEQGIPRKSDLYTRDLTLRDFTRRAYGEIRGVAFLPGSARVAFGAGSGREWMINLVGDTTTTHEAILTLKDQRFPPRPWSFSRDGKRLAFDHNGNLLVMPLDGDRRPQDFQRSKFEQRHPAFSPDGQSIAYDLSNGRGGRADVWVRPYPGPEPAFRVSTEGGSLPRWSQDGRRLYFVDAGGRIMVSDVLPGTPFRTSPSRPVPSRVEAVRAFAIAPDGTFYAIVNEILEPRPARAITVVTGWFDEVRHGPGGSQKK